MIEAEALTELVHGCVENFTWFGMHGKRPEEPAIVIRISDNATQELLEELKQTLGGRITSNWCSGFRDPQWMLHGDRAAEISKIVLKALKKLKPQKNVNTKIIAIEAMLYRWRNRKK